MGMFDDNTYYVKGDYSLFWAGPYSQWATSPFTFANIEYNCCEKFMMKFKALACGDTEIVPAIMKEYDPQRIKKLGRQVKNYSDEKWNEEVSMAVVYVANYCKFTQNDAFYKYLMADPGKIIVEASPYDKVWGIGLGKEDPKAWNVLTWQGQNRLGKCITQVRMFLQGNSAAIEYHNRAVKVVMELMSNGRLQA